MSLSPYTCVQTSNRRHFELQHRTIIILANLLLASHQTMYILILNKIGRILHVGRHFGFWLLRHISQTKNTMRLLFKP